VIYLLIQFMVVKNDIYVDVILIRMSSLILIPDFVNQTQFRCDHSTQDVKMFDMVRFIFY